jgi:hypothetical protein
VSFDSTAATIFGGMLSYPAMESRPVLRLERQESGLVAAGDRRPWTEGLYDPALRKITVWIPAASQDTDRIGFADVVAHEIAHHCTRRVRSRPSNP